MYTGSNIKAISSQRWLAASFTDLMRSMPYGKITIGNICSHADLSRQTFYNVFENKDEILRFALREAYEGRFRSLAKRDSLTVDDVVDSYVHVVEEKRSLLNAMIDNQLTTILSEEITRCVLLFVNRFVPTGEKDELLPYLEALLVGALSGILTCYLTQEAPISQDELSTLLHSFLSAPYYNLT